MGIKKFELSMLYDIYGTLLSNKQREAVEMYCNEDYSLSEVAENTGISRQGVRDQLQHAQSLLEGYEEKLRLMEKIGLASARLEELSRFEEVKSNKAISDIIEDLQDIFIFD